jgi:hypothetical protein
MLPPLGRRTMSSQPSDGMGLTPHGDLGPTPALGALAWDAANTERSLTAVFAHAAGTAEVAIHWYLQKKRPKQKNARRTRGWAIFLAAVAGLVPMVAQMYPRIPPVWASVALGGAAFLVVLDRFFGFSSAWMRYISTELQIRQLLDEFRLDWEAERATWKGAPPTEEQVQKALLRCRSFVTQVNAIVREETSLWVTEFQETLRQLDESVKTRTAATAAGAVNVTITNGDQSAGGWTLSVDNGVERTGQGKTAAVSAVAPGIHTIAVAGAINGRKVHAEVPVSVVPGAVSSVEVTLG